MPPTSTRPAAALRITAAGPFSLAAASRFGRGFTPSQTAGDDAQMRLAFPCEDAGWRAVGAHITQPGADLLVHVTVAGGEADEHVAAAAGEQCRRILSLDVDGTAFAQVADRDEVVAGLQERYPGLRPVLFCSPYEAAAWAIIGQRIRITQAAAIKRRISEELGERVDVDGAELAAFASPERLIALGATAGLSSRKVDQLQALGHAALDGRCSPARLRAGTHDATLKELQRMPGIGPFSADLVLVRGAGEPDHFPAHERRLQEAMRRAYGLGDDAGLDDLAQIAAGWQPFRSWVCVLLRSWIEHETGDIRHGRRSAKLPPSSPRRSG